MTLETVVFVLEFEGFHFLEGSLLEVGHFFIEKCFIILFFLLQLVGYVFGLLFQVFDGFLLFWLHFLSKLCELFDEFFLFLLFIEVLVEKGFIFVV